MVVVAVIVLMLLQFLTTFEMTMVMPLAPVIANIYHIDPASVTYLNIGFAAAGFLSPFFGYLADFFSMKRVLQLTVFFFSVGSFLVFTNTLPGYVLGRLILGIGYYNVASVAMAYTSLLIQPGKLGAVAGLYKVAFACGAFVSPLLGSYLAETIGFRFIYLSLALLGLFGTVILQVIPDIRVVQEEQLKMAHAFSLVKDRKAQYMLAANFFLSLPAVYFYNYFSVFLSSEGVGQETISQLYSVVAFGSIVAGVVIVFFSDRFGKRRLSVWSTAFSGLALSLFLFIKSPVVLAGFFFGLGYDTIWGLFYPAASTFYRTKSATFLAILTFTTSLTNVFTNVTGPLLYSVGSFPLLVVISSIGLLGASFFMKQAFALDKSEQPVTVVTN